MELHANFFWGVDGFIQIEIQLPKDRESERAPSEIW
jgi:hypothetical protein